MRNVNEHSMVENIFKFLKEYFVAKIFAYLFHINDNEGAFNQKR